MLRTFTLTPAPPSGPTARRDHNLVALDADTVVLFGGTASGDVVPADQMLWVFEVRARTWHRVRRVGEEGPAPRGGACAFARAGSLFCMFGATGIMRAVDDPTLWEGKIARREGGWEVTWAPHRNAATTWPKPRWGAAVAVDRARVWMSCGGVDEYSAHDDLWALDLDSLTWRQFNSPAQPRGSGGSLCGLFVHEGHLVRMFGDKLYGGFSTTAEYFDEAASRWKEITVVADLPEDIDDDEEEEDEDEEEEEDEEEDRTIRRTCEGMIIHKGRVHIIGGFSPSEDVSHVVSKFAVLSSPLPNLHGADPTMTFTANDDAPEALRRVAHSATVAGNTVVVFGGMTGGAGDPEEDDEEEEDEWEMGDEPTTFTKDTWVIE